MMNNLEDEVKRIVERMDNQEKEQDAQNQPEDIQDVYVLIVREQEEAEEHTHVVDSTPVKHKPDVMAFLPVSVFLLLICSTLLFQVYCIMNPPIATITILPKSQHVTVTGTVQLGRVLPPLTISQSQTTPATGKVHQDAKQATGTVTFFNGLFTQQFISQGSVYTGNDGVAIVTTQDATIPPGNPNSGYGTRTVTAQAVAAGTSGNIQAGDVNITINNGLLVQNNQFSGGQNERTYTTVTHNDIHRVSTVLKTTISHSITGALQGQLHQGERLQLLPCSPTVTSDHQPGDEATSVKVTVAETCSAIAYNSQELETKATSFLATQAQQKAGAGYSLFGTVQVRVTQATVNNTPPHLVFLSFKASGTWIYGLSTKAQQQIKHLIAGKTTQKALQLLRTLPGVEQASIRLSGFGDNTRLPKQSKNIHLVIIVV